MCYSPGIGSRVTLGCAPMRRIGSVCRASASDRPNVVEKIAKFSTVAGGFIAPLLISEPALAIGREYGIVEGQIFSLIHPAFMFFLLGASLYAGYLGFQWRRARELATEIKELKAQRGAAAPAEGEAAPPSPLDSTIANLEKVSLALCSSD